MVRLKDIAAQAGVSVMTVSKVMRDAPDISAATKVRIRALAEQLGYTPNSVAQGLRNKTTKLLGLVISAVTNPVFARVVMSIEEQAYQLGYDVVFGQSLSQPEREQAVIRRMLSRRVDGIFITPVYRLDQSAPIYDELLRRGTPTVLLGHRAPFCSGFVNVETDDIAASQSATRHLLEAGHKRIAFFTGPNAAPSSHERLDGYRRALREAGIDVDDKLIFHAGSTIEEGEKAALQMLQEMPGATAVQAANDLVAIGAGNVLLGQGLRIPDDISLVGFGNVLVSEHFRVPLTTIRQPKLRLGTAAVDSMLKLLGGTRPPSKRLNAEIVIRQSSGPPPHTELQSAPKPKSSPQA